MFDKSIAVRAICEGHIERLGIIQSLLHSRADRVIVVFCLYDRDWDVRLLKQYVARLLRFTSLDRLATNDDAALCEITLLEYLRHHVPLRTIRPKNRGGAGVVPQLRVG